MFSPFLSFLPELTRRASGALAVAALAVSLAPAAHAAGVLGQGTWQTTLQGRDLDSSKAGFEAYYDTALNITWLTDANYAKTTNYAAVDTFGRMTWADATTWADNLVVGAYSDWRLPTMVDTGTSGCNYSSAGGTDCGMNVQTKDAVTGTVYSEMAHLFYVTLGNKAYATPGIGASTPQANYGFKNTGPFFNGQAISLYWLGAAYAPNTNSAWYFNTSFGNQENTSKGNKYSAWAVRTGDVAAAVTVVPEPQTYALVLAGLAVAGVLARKHRA
jgi:Protein of unknown function (DUF1566)/PEP-CTERM motif